MAESTKGSSTNARAQESDTQVTPLSGSVLESLLPAGIPGYERTATISVHHGSLNTNEATATYIGPSGNAVTISIADLGNHPKLYRNFLSGGGLRQSVSGNSFGMQFRQSSLQGSANYGLLLQASPAFPGQPSGVVGMAQLSQPVQFSVLTQASPQASPQYSPQASPQYSPQASPQYSPQASPQYSPQASPQYSPQASPQYSPQASPQFSPQASPQFSPQASPQFSPQASPQASPQFSPQVSPQFSPQGSPQFSPQASPQFSPQVSPQFSPQASPQASPQFSPQASPQASPQFSPQVSPQFSPQASPQFSPQAFPQFSPQASPQFSPQVSPQFSPQASPQFSPQASPQFSPQASPQVSPQFSPQASPQFSPQASPQFSPQASPQFSPQASPQLSQASVVFSQPPDGKRIGFSAGQTSLSPAQVSDQLQRSGIDLKQFSQISQESPFSLTQASSVADGSFIRPFGLDTGYDVAGWELYDGNMKAGDLILGINDRLGILVEASAILPGALLDIADKFDFGEADRAIGKGK